MPTERISVDMTGCPCCEEGECCCDPDPECLVASIVGSGDCSCITADLELDAGSGSFFYEYGCGVGDLRQFDIQLSRIEGSGQPCTGYQMTLTDGAAMACEGTACVDTCEPFVLEFEFSLDVFESGADCNESSCTGTLTITITECP